MVLVLVVSKRQSTLVAVWVRGYFAVDEWNDFCVSTSGSAYRGISSFFPA